MCTCRVLLLLLTNGKLLITPNHAFIGPNRIDLTKDTVYSHPSTQQCSGVNATYFGGYTYGQFMTKVEESGGGWKTLINKDVSISVSNRNSHIVNLITLAEIRKYTLLKIETTPLTYTMNSTNKMVHVTLGTNDNTTLYEYPNCWPVGNYVYGHQDGDQQSAGLTETSVFIFINTKYVVGVILI